MKKIYEGPAGENYIERYQLDIQSDKDSIAVLYLMAQRMRFSRIYGIVSDSDGGTDGKRSAYISERDFKKNFTSIDSLLDWYLSNGFGGWLIDVDHVGIPVEVSGGTGKDEIEVKYPIADVVDMESMIKVIDREYFK